MSSYSAEPVSLDQADLKSAFKILHDRVLSFQREVSGLDSKLCELMREQLNMLAGVSRSSGEQRIPSIAPALDLRLRSLADMAALPPEASSWLRRLALLLYELTMALPSDGYITTRNETFIKSINEISVAIPELFDSLEVVKDKWNIRQTISGWESDLASHTARLNSLKKFIDDQTSSLNFVVLNKAFANMRGDKSQQLISANKTKTLFGWLMCLPLVSQFIWSQHKNLEFSWNLLATGIPAISLTIILLYFFRIALRNVESIKSQLLQIELREALCQFVQGYADYAGPIQEKHPEMLGKFESLVFSSIVASDEKIPSTFDGIDQIANLLKAIQGK